ncbi:MAG: chemotaxis protein CheX [Actinomycetota bacterium]|nr:chemotaxis protein CheX [Actinomycetota bacterium]
MLLSELIGPETIEEIAHQLWASLVPTEGVLVPSACALAHLHRASGRITAAVSISGSCDGTVELACSEPLGRAIAAFMFGLPEADLDEAAVTDAVGELANIVGGNVKSLLPPPTSLSIPIVTTGPTASDEGRTASCAVGFDFLGEPALVLVRDASLAPA